MEQLNATRDTPRARLSVRWAVALAVATSCSAACAKAPPPAAPPKSPDTARQPSESTPAEPGTGSDDATTLAPPTYEVGTEVVEARPVVEVRVEVAPNELSRKFAEVFGAIYPYVAEQGATPSGAPYGCYHEFGPDRVVVDIGVPVSQALPPSGDLKSTELAAGPIAFTTHVGSYQHLQRAHDAVKRWIDRNGKRVLGVPCDQYEVGPGQVSEESRYRTRVVYWIEDG